MLDQLTGMTMSAEFIAFDKGRLASKYITENHGKGLIAERHYPAQISR